MCNLDFIIIFIIFRHFKIWTISFLLQILPFLLERILSLGFDVISNVLETGPVSYLNFIHLQFICNYSFNCKDALNFVIYIFFRICFKYVIFQLTQGWRLVSPHFTTLLESAIFPALVMNEKVSFYFVEVTGMDFFLLKRPVLINVFWKCNV